MLSLQPYPFAWHLYNFLSKWSWIILHSFFYFFFCSFSYLFLGKKRDLRHKRCRCWRFKVWTNLPKARTARTKRTVTHVVIPNHYFEFVLFILSSNSWERQGAPGSTSRYFKTSVTPTLWVSLYAWTKIYVNLFRLGRPQNIAVVLLFG